MKMVIKFSKYRYIGVGYLGVYFTYYGDEITWIWPWKWRGYGRWLSVGFEDTFPTLRSIKDLWDKYDLLCK